VLIKKKVQKLVTQRNWKKNKIWFPVFVQIFATHINAEKKKEEISLSLSLTI